MDKVFAVFVIYTAIIAAFVIGIKGASEAHKADCDDFGNVRLGGDVYVCTKEVK